MARDGPRPRFGNRAHESTFCGATWLTGSYDAELDLLHWATGNPCPDMNCDRRPGGNLYTNSVVALRPRSGGMHDALDSHQVGCRPRPSIPGVDPARGVIDGIVWIASTVRS